MNPILLSFLMALGALFIGIGIRPIILKEDVKKYHTASNVFIELGAMLILIPGAINSGSEILVALIILICVLLFMFLQGWLPKS